MMNFYGLLPFVRMRNDVPSGCYAAHGFGIVVHEKKPSTMPGRGFYFYNMRGNFLNDLVPIHKIPVGLSKSYNVEVSR